MRLHGIRDALRDIRRPALNPLLAATETKNQQLLIELVNVIGDIGYYWLTINQPAYR